MADLSDIDEASLQLILELQRMDIQEGLAASKTRPADSKLRDAVVATALDKVAIHQQLIVRSDRRMAISISNAVMQDAENLAGQHELEATARQDRELALRLREEAPMNQARLERPIQPPSPTLSQLSDENLATLAALYNSLDAGIELRSKSSCISVASMGGSSVSGNIVSKHSALKLDHTCIVCLDDKSFFEVVRVTCNHEYCRACIRDLYERATIDETLFPPRCCGQPISTESVELFLTREIKDNLEAKREEFTSSDRTYCHDPHCGGFISTSLHQEQTAICKDCNKSTCTICKEGAHEGDCPKDTELQATLELAEREGWCRCSGCRALIELTRGCYHMSCRCGRQFCYLCNVDWKNCSCRQWDETRLLDAAAVIVDRDGPNDIVNRQQQVTDAARRLIARHECTHEDWRVLRGEHDCVECGDTLFRYIFECEQCRILACRRCRLNRL